MNLRMILGLLCGAFALAASGVAAPAANDFPTVDRVLYVQECMRQHPGPFYEMVNKCSCALDALASEVSYDDYVSMSTMANATSIGGERGGVIRDNEPAQAQIKRYKALQSKVQKGCFINPETK
jgi:hypothetical protein